MSTFKKILFLSQVIMLCLLPFSVKTNAQTTENNRYDIKRVQKHSSHTVNNINFVEVAHNNGRPLNQKIRLEIGLAANYDVSIKMKNRYGGVVWEELKSFNTGKDKERTFWCGNDVYSVEVKLYTEDPWEKIIRPWPVATCVTYYNVR